MSAYPNQKGQFEPLPRPVESAPLCCGTSAKTWTQVGVILNLVGCVLAFIGCLAFLLFVPQPQPETADAKQALEIFNIALIIGAVVSGLGIALAALVLHGVNNEKICLITLWLVLSIIGVVSAAFKLIAALVTGISIGGFIFNILMFAVNCFFVHATCIFRKEVNLAQQGLAPRV